MTGIDRAKINKFTDYIESLVIDRNLGSNKPRVRICRHHINTFTYYRTKAILTSRLVRTIMSKTTVDHKQLDTFVENSIIALRICFPQSTLHNEIEESDAR